MARDMFLSCFIVLTMIEDILIPYISERFTSGPAYREGHLRIVNPLPGVPVLGLHIPDMKKIAKELAARDDVSVLLDRLETSGPGLYYEETAVWGLVLDYVKLPSDERLSRFGSFIPRIDNWAVCDTVCGASKWVMRRDRLSGSGKGGRTSCTAPDVREAVWDFLDRWWGSGREFEVRFAVIMAMCHFLCPEWLDKVFEKIDTLDFSRIASEYVTIGDRRRRGAGSVDGEPQSAESFLIRSEAGYSLSGLKAGTVLGATPYYVRMGVAWLLATSLAKFPEHTRSFVRTCSLPEDVLRLYVRKARESFRTRDVSPV